MISPILSSIATLIGVIVGVIITLHVMRVEVNQRYYTHIDDFYRELIKLYLIYPKFSDPKNTNHYDTVFMDEELARYEFFAMSVHTFLETIYDQMVNKKTGRIDPLWEKIFDYHAKLHLRWLTTNEPPNEPEYVAFVKERFKGR